MFRTAETRQAKRRSPIRGHLLVAGCALFVLAGCPTGQPASKASQASPAPGTQTPATPSASLTVWCEPAVIPALTALTPDFTFEPPMGVELVPRTRGQLLQAVQATEVVERPDVIVFSDTPVRQALLEGGWIDETSLRTFAGDRLVLVQPAGGQLSTPTLFDLYRSGMTGFGMLNQDTIEGYYGQQALVTEGVLDRIQDRLKEYPALDSIGPAFAAGEIQLALVLASEADRLPGIKPFFVIGEDLHEDIRYQAAQVPGTTQPAAALAYLRLLGEDPAAQQKLVGFGLVDRRAALVEDR